MPVKLRGMLKRAGAARTDPFWTDFIHTPPIDPRNLVTEAFKGASEDAVNPVRAEIHSPNVMAQHIKELGRFWGADQVGIVRLTATRESELPFGILAVVKAEYDPRQATGIGGQTPAMKGLFATFCVAAYIRELGYQARRSGDNGDRLAAIAGLGALDREGHLVSRAFGRKAYVAEVIRTELPLEPDGLDDGQ